MMASLSTRGGFWAMIIVFVLWAVLLAIGATGIFTDTFDARRSMIVLGCSAVFLGFWCWVYTRPRTAAASSPTPGTSWMSLLSLVLVGVAYVLWGAAWVAFKSPNGQWTRTFSWLSLAAMGTGGVMALIGLSDARPRRGKLVGLATVFLLALAVVIVIIQAI